MPGSYYYWMKKLSILILEKIKENKYQLIIKKYYSPGISTDDKIHQVRHDEQKSSSCPIYADGDKMHLSDAWKTVGSSTMLHNIIM